MEDRMSGFCIKAGNGGGNGVATTGTKCGRWNPTAEQVKVLTDLFRSGLRTPSTDQIQKISTQLSFYGKIESKNVFYWFQNHKARERQKRRKVSVDHHHHRPDPDQRDVVRRIDHKINSSPKHFVEVSEVTDHLQSERVIETLQLFPLNSFEEDEDEPENHKLMRMHANNYHQDQTATTTTTFSYTIASDDQMNHPPLDLRLSFM